MKRTIFLLFMVLSGTGYGQKLDTIFTHKGDTLLIKIIEIQDSNVKYKFPGEDVINNIPFTDFSHIALGSGRKIVGENRIIVKDIKDWEKVIITSNPNDVKNLEKVIEITARSTSPNGAYGNLEREKNKAKQELKRKAASNGCHIVLITEDNSKDGKTNQSFKWTKASLTGIAYRYKK